MYRLAFRRGHPVRRVKRILSASLELGPELARSTSIAESRGSLPHLGPVREPNPTTRDPIAGNAVLEYGPIEISLHVGAILVVPAAHCRPRRRRPVTPAGSRRFDQACSITHGQECNPSSDRDVTTHRSINAIRQLAMA